MERGNFELKRVVKHARLVSSARVASRRVRGGALSVVFATLLSLGFACACRKLDLGV